jgi:hypothetical protein
VGKREREEPESERFRCTCELRVEENAYVLKTIILTIPRKSVEIVKKVIGQLQASVQPGEDSLQFFTVKTV